MGIIGREVAVLEGGVTERIKGILVVVRRR